jgi:signal transduction histidine kinase
MKAESARNVDIELLVSTQEMLQTIGWEYNTCRRSLSFTRPLNGFLFQQTAPKTLKELTACFEEEVLINAGIESAQSLDMVIREKGARKWFRLVVSPIRQRGHLVKVRGALMDVSDRKLMEEELNNARLQAEETARTKQQFLANMSHEIRTPMSAVIGMTHLLLQENPRPDQLENLKTLKFLGNNLLGLVNDTLDYCKIESGKITFERIDFNLTELVNNIKKAHQLKAEEKGLALLLHVDSALPEFVKGDAFRLTQILNNLIGNAIKFTQKGAVTVELGLHKMLDQSVQIAFEISDTGIGIDPAQQSYIFEVFAQANPQVVRHFGGTGLGLAITKRLLELQGSDIHVQSVPNEGSCFTFCLNFGRSNESKAMDRVGNHDSNHFKSLAGYKVLVADDNKINSTVALSIMKKWDLEIDIARTGAEALEKAMTTSYDLILMDLQMPVMDGYTASTRIRTLPEERFQQLPIIALTASLRNDVKFRMRKAGMTDYISKPYSPCELYNKIVQYLC